MVRIALQALGRRTPTWFSRWRRQGSLSRFPDCGVRLNAYYILQAELGNVRAKLRAFPITRIGQNLSRRHFLLQRLPNLLQRDLWLGLKLNPFRYARFPAGVEFQPKPEIALEQIRQ